VDEYLALRRALGFDLRRTERLLRKFVIFAEQQGARSVTPSRSWRSSTCGSSSAGGAYRDRTSERVNEFETVVGGSSM